jgi:peptidoglycan/xylan/chitin deacetylase (PgdA/CDA1 family)
LYPLINKIGRKILEVSSRNLTGTITGVLTEDPIASLTFDDGPDPFYSFKVLEILRKYEAHATFFMVGEAACSYPYIVSQIAREGHAIGNHSWDHLAFPFITFLERLDQIRRCHRVLKPHGQRLFRPPYGMINKKASIEVLLQGYKVIGWSFSTEDWCETNTGVMVDSLLKNIRRGSIILLHDRLFDGGKPKRGPMHNQEAVVDREPMLFVLNKVLKAVNGNIQFVTIPTLLRRGQALREKW